ncbi:winged helix DNA-binding domain-containing protein [Rhizopogon vinicolor AM-OR11-026]|uniref:Winged helix DNA-binding domain-containing protein n=1 Tax=Rhizopogon vinicolor AM-OR11-026 TaxID=1314800 RepID=A0A1B7MNA5_9AGAM|nr:winged helix DNA-binding domain-containing protein [Rhizopogon vinicolor AM-OR11-026]
MALSTHTTPSGFLLPSIHSAPPFFTYAEQPNPNTQAHLTEQWIRLILTYARHRRLFILRVEDAEVPGGDWDEILRNEGINRQVPSSYISSLMAAMAAKNVAVYEPPKQTQWADVLHSWATATGQLNTILTFYEISDPPIPSPLSDIPIPLLRRAITILMRSNRAQIIGVADGEGVRFFAATK